MDVATFKKVLAGLRKSAGERPVERGTGADDLIDALSEQIGDSEKQAGIDKRAFLRRRSDLLVAKMLAGIDALAAQG